MNHPTKGYIMSSTNPVAVFVPRPYTRNEKIAKAFFIGTGVVAVAAAAIFVLAWSTVRFNPGMADKLYLGKLIEWVKDGKLLGLDGAAGLAGASLFVAALSGWGHESIMPYNIKEVAEDALMEPDAEVPAPADSTPPPAGVASKESPYVDHLFK